MKRKCVRVAVSLLQKSPIYVRYRRGLYDLALWRCASDPLLTRIGPYWLSPLSRADIWPCLRRERVPNRDGLSILVKPWLQWTVRTPG